MNTYKDKKQKRNPQLSENIDEQLYTFMLFHFVSLSYTRRADAAANHPPQNKI